MTNFNLPPPLPTRCPGQVASTLSPQPSTCLPHPSLAPCARQLDHWFETQTLLHHQVQDLLRPHVPSAHLPTNPCPDRPSPIPPIPPILPTAPPKTDLCQETPPQPSTHSPPRPSPPGTPPSESTSQHYPEAAPNLFSALFASLRSTCPSGLRCCPPFTQALPLPTLLLAAANPSTLHLVNHILNPFLDWQKLLLKHAQLALACQKLQNKAAHPPETQATGTKPDGDNSEIIALMRKAFFADVDEWEKSGQVVLPD